MTNVFEDLIGQMLKFWTENCESIKKGSKNLYKLVFNDEVETE